MFGEPWPQTIDAAQNRSGRLLALMSANSIEKDLPVSERTKGLRIGHEVGEVAQRLYDEAGTGTDVHRNMAERLVWYCLFPKVLLLSNSAG